MSEATPFSSYQEAFHVTLASEKLGLLAQEIKTERPHGITDELREALEAVLQTLHIEKAQDIIQRLEQSLQAGYHDRVHEFLTDLAKMRHNEFAQELLHDLTLRHLGAGVVLNRDIDATKVGRHILGLTDSAPEAAE